MPSGWFSRAQYPILAAYCRHTVRATHLAQLIARFEPDWITVEGGLQRLDKLLAMAERETRAITACARSMRLTQQAQIQPRGAGRAVANSSRDGNRPWD
jgi:formate-dependent phosphoribosylglycinamide formyltransferase (GAR transformylase)